MNTRTIVNTSEIAKLLHFQNLQRFFLLQQLAISHLIVIDRRTCFMFITNFAHSGVWYTIEDGVPSSKLTLAYKESFQFNEVNKELASILDQAGRGNKIYSHYATSFPWQVYCYRSHMCSLYIRNLFLIAINFIHVYHQKFIEKSNGLHSSGTINILYS